jgi:glutathione S-transferase
MPDCTHTPALELWQTEWCPASHRVRQRLTELGVSYVARQVPVQPQDRSELMAATGERSIPVLVDGGDIVAGEDAIVAHLNTHFAETAEAERQRAKAVKAKNKELEQACPQFSAAATH